MHVAGSPVYFPPVASSSRIRPEESETVTSLDADSELYYGLPNSPADISGNRFGGFDQAAQVRSGMRFLPVGLRVHSCGPD
jgi:hypothetical protein